MVYLLVAVNFACDEIAGCDILNVFMFFVACSNTILCEL